MGHRAGGKQEPGKGIALNMLLTVPAPSQPPLHAHTAPPLLSVEEAVLSTTVWSQMLGQEGHMLPAPSLWAA